MDHFFACGFQHDVEEALRTFLPWQSGVGGFPSNYKSHFFKQQIVGYRKNKIQFTLISSQSLQNGKISESRWQKTHPPGGVVSLMWLGDDLEGSTVPPIGQ